MNACGRCGVAFKPGDLVAAVVPSDVAVKGKVVKVETKKMIHVFCPSDRCYRCGKVIDEVAEDFVVDVVERAMIEPGALDKTVTVKVDEKRHARCDWGSAPSPFDPYPKKPGRGWMDWACRALGLAEGGTHAQVAERLRAEGFDDIEAPSDAPINYGLPKKETT